MSSDTFWDRLQTAAGSLSNRALAAKCGISEGTIRRYLRRETYPSLDTLRSIADATGCNLSWLATGEGPMHRARTTPASVPPPAGTAHIPAPIDFDDHNLAEGMSLLAKIYGSGDAAFIRAINLNLTMFGEALDHKAAARGIPLLMERIEKRMAETEKKLHHLERENQALRTRMGG